MDIRESVRHVQGNRSDCGVTRKTGSDRRAVKQYRQWAAAHSLLSSPLPSVQELQAPVKKTLGNALPPPWNVSSVEAYRDIATQCGDLILSPSPRCGVRGQANCDRLEARLKVRPHLEGF